MTTTQATQAGSKQTNGKAPTPYTGLDRLFIDGAWVAGRSEHKLSPR